MWRKGNPSALLVGMKTGAATVEYLCFNNEKCYGENKTETNE